MASHDEQILTQLRDISFQLGDLNAIRNGEYDPPRGAERDQARIMATPDDIYSQLGTIVGLLERMNMMIYNIGRNNVGKEEWERQNRN